MDDGYDDTTSFDGNGNVTEFDVSGTRNINYAYNEEDQLTLVDYTSGTDTTFDYDDGGRQIEMVDSTGTTAWEYDLADRVTLLDAPGYDLTYTYNNAGQRTKMTEVGVGDTDYSYDATSGELEQVSNRFGEDTVYAYDGLGRVQRKTFENGQYELYGYDSRYRVTDIDLKNSSNTVLKAQDYGFDAASRVTGYTTGGVTTTYGYDDADQLTSESRTGYSASYTYDENGNRLTRAISGGVSEAYSYDAGDKLLGVTWSGGYKDFVYDAEGRMTEYDNNGSTRYFAYDDESRITGISGAYTASYTYNGLDTRVAKTENSVSNTFKRDGVGVTAPVLNDGSAAYTPGISERRSSTTTYLHSGLKNAEAQTGTGQTVTSERTYDAFGNVLNTATGAWVGPFGYGGEFGYQEDATGLKLLGHRYYDPTLGRFLTRDPIRHGRNWYTYCANNPISYMDSSGDVPVLVAIAICLILGTGTAYAPTGRETPQDFSQTSSDLGGRKLEMISAVLDFLPGFGAKRVLGARKATNPLVEVVERIRPGKRGGYAHREAVERAEKDFKDAGYTHIAGGSLPERKVGNRYPDLEFQDQFGRRRFVQVGKGKADGSPVTREVDAAGDLAESGEVDFVPYNK